MSIQLPFEAATTQFFADDPKLINFRYFFTRKLEFVKESDAFVLLPGGLRHARRGVRAAHAAADGQGAAGPVVLLDVPGGTYWQELAGVRHRRAGEARLRRRPTTSACSCVTDDVDVAVDEVIGFYSNYRLAAVRRRAPRAARCGRRRRRKQLDELNTEFADIVVRGEIERVEAAPAEIADDDHVDLARVAFWFDRRSWARLRMLIDRLNGRSGS